MPDYINKVVDREGNTLIDLTGDDVTQADVKTGVKFHDKSGAQKEGTFAGIIPTGKITITSGSEIDCAAYATAQVSDANLKAENIKSGVTILGITGTHAGSGSLAISTTGNKDVGDYKYAYIDVANIANLDPANIVKDVTILGVTGTAVAGTGTGDAKLNTPSISLGTLTPSSDPLYIYNYYNGNFVTYYDIYKDDVLLTTVSGSTSTVTVNLRTYISTDGTYSIKVVARGTGMQDSAASTAVSYQHKTYVTITNTLVNCSSSNAATSAVKGDSYSATLTAASGYSFVGATIQITMGGTDITSTALNENEISIVNVTGDIAIVANFAVITQLATPSNVALSGDSLSWSAVTNATSYGIYANGALKTTTTSTSFDMSTLTFGAQDDYAITVTAIANGYTESNPSSESITYTYAGSTVDPVLENNDWATIRAVCEAGDAGNTWSLGDEKNVTVGSYTRPVKLVHVGNIYSTKKAVFQFWYRTEANIVWDASNSNDVTTADIWDALASGGTAYTELIDGNLGPQLTDTTVQVAKNGNDGTITTLTGKLFLPAEKEITASPSYSRSEERAVLTTFGYYVANDNAATRVKHKASAPTATSSQMWWLRSPRSGYSDLVCRVASSGNLVYDFANYTNVGVAPCFAW